MEILSRTHVYSFTERKQPPQKWWINIGAKRKEEERNQQQQQIALRVWNSLIL